MTIEKVQTRSLCLFSAMLAMAAFCAPAYAQVSRSVEIKLPSNASKNPSVNRPALEVSPGESVEFKLRGNGSVFMIFTNPGKTPFVNNRGEPVYSFRLVQAGNRYKIRTDENPCVETEAGKSACKYMLVDMKSPQRPPLDPYIIIR
jgi:hypothetical protein